MKVDAPSPSFRETVLTKETLIPAGIVLVLLGYGYWLGGTVQRLEAAEKQILRIEDVEKRTAILENRQGITETQYMQINGNFVELKEDIKAIQKALKITP